MTYQQRSDYILADKLKKEFYDRGQNLSGMRASSTSELMRRAALGREPGVNCSEEAFRENYKNHCENRTSRMKKDTVVHDQGHEKRERSNCTDCGNTSRHSSSTKRAKKAPESSTAHTNTRKKINEKITPVVELKIKSKFLSPVFIMSLLIGTVMVMFLVFNISEVYEMTNEVSQLESELENLEAAAEQLELKLEEKNDIREIENIATSKLGMVKEDVLQRRYISLSEGERIEILDSGEEDETAGGVLLSSVFSSLNKFFERFK